MRNPNYKYVPDKDGWVIAMNGMVVCWGKTKAAARSRALRLLRKRFQGKTTEEIYSTLKGEGGLNDQS